MFWIPDTSFWYPATSIQHYLLLYATIMLNIIYPEPSFRIRKEGSKEMIFDQQRKRWVRLTEEEWVRQNFVQYLIATKHYPATLIAIEKELWLGELRKRFDILVYDKDHKPWMMVECKGKNIPLNDQVLEQLLRYHSSIPVPFLVITNGNVSFGWEKTESQLEPISEFPVFKSS